MGISFGMSWLRFAVAGETAGRAHTQRGAGPGLSLKLFKKIETHERPGVPEIGPSGKTVRRRAGGLCGRGGTGRAPLSHEPPPKAAGFRFLLFANGDTGADRATVTCMASGQAGIELNGDLSGPRCPSKYQNKSWK